MTEERQPIRVMFYVAEFFPRAKGAAYAARHLARALRVRGVDVSFLTDSSSGVWTSGETFEGFPVRSFPFCRPGKIGKALTAIRFAMYVLHQRHTIEVFHIHGGDYVSLFLGWLARKLSGCRTVLKITSDGWDTPEGVQSGRYGGWIARLYRELDGVVAMSTGQANQVKAWGIGGQLARIPNGVDIRKFVPPSQLERDSARASLGIAPECPVLVYSGYLSEMKGVDVLVETWNCIRNQCPTSRLILIGNYLDSEKQRTEVSAFLESKQISPESLFIPEVIHVGVTDTPECFLAAGDVFVFPSRLEGFGTVQIEAMACGLACVVNDLPGLSSDIFPDGETGIRIQDNDVTRFAAAVLDLIRAPEKRIRMGVAARERAEAVFSIDRVADRYVALYQDLLGIEEASDRP